MYYDSDGDLHVFLKDTSLVASAAARFANLIGHSHRPSSLPAVNHAPAMHTHVGQFDFAELLELKTALSIALVPLNADLAFIGIDERTNKVAVETTNSGRIASIRDVAKQAGIPMQALDISLGQRSSIVSDTVSLSNYVRPIVGGFKFVSLGTGGGSPCSIGIPVQWSLGAGSYSAGFLTAQHCFFGSADSAFMTDSLGSPHIIGTLAFDGNWTYSCVHNGINQNNCMHADAALMALNRIDGQFWTNYAIAHGSSSTTSGYSAGTFALNQSTYSGTSSGPFISDAALLGGAEVVGDWVNKIGFKTGWTIGQIDAIGDRQRGSDLRWIIG